MISKRARVMIALSGLLVLSMPAFAQHRYNRRYYSEREGEFRLHLGAFRPDGNSQYWDDVQADFTGGDPSDLEGASFGLDYLLPLGSDRLSLMFSGSYYSGSNTLAYRGFEDNFGDRIRHDTNLDIGSATIGLVFHLTPAGAPIQPYIGAGGGAFPWRLEESGDFIGAGPTLPIFTDRLTSSGTAFGYYFLGGIEAPITRRVSIFAEGRWTRVDADLNDDFEGFGKLDLGGREFAAGLSWSL
jgi:opacity protein-like surface antigen